MTTMHLPAFSGRWATWWAAASAAPAGDADEQPLVLGGAAGPVDGLILVDRHHLVDDLEVEHLGHEAGADALDLVRARA